MNLYMLNKTGLIDQNLTPVFVFVASDILIGIQEVRNLNCKSTLPWPPGLLSVP